MKAAAEAIIELARNSWYVEGTATEKSITPAPAFNSTEFPHRLHNAETLNSYEKEGKVNSGSVFPATNSLRSSIYFLRL